MLKRKTCFSAHVPGDKGTRDRSRERWRKGKRKGKRIPPYLCENGVKVLDRGLSEAFQGADKV